MPDAFDFATEQYDDWLANQIENQRRKVAVRTCLPVGRCHNCDEPLPEPLLFCNADCAFDFEKRSYFNAQIIPL